MLKIALLLVALLAVSYCDLPVHCMKHQIQGRWKLLSTAPELKGYGSLPCGHHTPDSQKTSYAAGQDDFHAKDELLLNLSEDYSVSEDANSEVGRWTMVYDEGFEVIYKNVKYFSFSKYAPEGHDYKSYCGETLVGWYNNLNTGERGCYRANKLDSVGSSDSLEMRSVVQPEFMEEKQQQSNELDSLQNKDDLDFTLDITMIQTGEKKNKAERVSVHSEFADHDLAADRLNKIENKNWNAKAHSEFSGKSFKELNQMAGRKKYYQKSQARSNSFAQMSTGDYKHYSREDVSDLPTQYTLEQYLSAPRQQKQCGSCYAIATMEMLSARLKMQGEEVDLSPQYSLDCNYYNQGCDGGYPYLVEKFAQEHYLLTEQQYPYAAQDQNCKKPDFSTYDKVYSVKNYRYIGGGYGLGSERAIMEEIYQNGPVILNFEPTYDFMYYQSGIYHSVDAADWIEYNKGAPEWEKVDHSVLCFGWGEENGEKYWILQNSWGPDWGEGGNFRIRRGTDESAVESMAEAADPIVLKRGSNNNFFVQQTMTVSNTELPLHFYAFVQQKHNLRKVEQ